MDNLTSDERSKQMSLIRSTDTKPELRVRRIVHGLGYRYRLHAAELPGKPDLVFPSRRKVIFINGCFWHGHSGCPKGRPPKLRPEYWLSKIEQNARKDELNIEQLGRLGWKTLAVWQCELKDQSKLRTRLVDFLAE